MPPRRKKPADHKRPLKEGEYPKRVTMQTASGDPFRMEVIEQVPPSKRPLAPIQDALLSEFLLPQFEHANINGATGFEALLLLARMGAWRYDSLKRFVVAYQDLCEESLYREIFPLLPFAPPTLEQCCDVAKLSYEDFVGDITKQMYHYGQDGAKRVIQMRMGEVVEAAFNSAKDNGARGYNDRKLLMEAGQVIAQQPGQVINVNTQLNAQTTVVGLPQWKESDKIVVDALRPTRKAITEQSAAPLEPVEAEVIKEIEHARSEKEPDDDSRERP